MIKRREKSFSLQVFWNSLFQRKINVHKNWLRHHSSWAPCGIWMKIKGILKSCFWILLHQDMLSFLYSRIQDYMLSIINEVDSCVASAVSFVWDVKPIFPTFGIRARFSISWLYSMWLDFRINEKRFFDVYSRFDILNPHAIYYMWYILVFVNQIVAHDNVV